MLTLHKLLWQLWHRACLLVSLEGGKLVLHAERKRKLPKTGSIAGCVAAACEEVADLLRARIS